jgi:hypothetical protein
MGACLCQVSGERVIRAGKISEKFRVEEYLVCFKVSGRRLGHGINHFGGESFLISRGKSNVYLLATKISRYFSLTHLCVSNAVSLFDTVAHSNVLKSSLERHNRDP